ASRRAKERAAAATQNMGETAGSMAERITEVVATSAGMVAGTVEAVISSKSPELGGETPDGANGEPADMVEGEVVGSDQDVERPEPPSDEPGKSIH
ncbi:MAG TPA: hypothetical protein VLJ39_00270, partial [Tepidisphaeraceae bacterium]|nr:hypothetical protein [Tepidisphaeraceae bacterium]